MTGKTHMAIGIATGLILARAEPAQTQLVCILACAVGSLVPDLDHPKAKLNQNILLLKNKFNSILLYLSLTIGFIYLYFTKENILFGLVALMTFLISISTHRGFTHSILGYVLATSIVRILSLEYDLPYMYLGFSIGYITHLIGDFLTVKGIKLFYPIGKNIAFPIMSISNKNSIKNISLMLLGLYFIYFLSTSVIFPLQITP